MPDKKAVSGFPGVCGDILKVGEVLAREVEPTVWAVEDLIAEQDIGLISGTGGIGKSYVLMSLAISLASGKPLFGRFPVRRQYRVLYIDQEMPEGATVGRFKRMLLGEDYEPKDDDRLLIGTRGQLTLDIQGREQGLYKLAHEAKREWILVDSLPRALSRNENDTETANAFFRVIKQFRDDFGCGFIGLSHWRKLQREGELNEPGERLRGAAAWRDIVDHHICVFKGQEEDTVMLKPEKVRHGDKPNKDVIHLAFQHDDPMSETGPFRLRSPLDGFESEVAQKLWEALPAHDQDPIHVSRFYQGEARLASKVTVFKWLNRLVHSNRVEVVGTHRHGSRAVIEGYRKTK